MNISSNDLIIKFKFILNIRMFFINKGYIEVNTPSISNYSDNSCNLNPIKLNFNINNIKNNKFYLITSPEFHMKRILSRNLNKSIFQICNCFRNDNITNIHNIEFIMLEWYKLNSNLFNLMKELDSLLKIFFIYKKPEFITYKDIFIKYLNINPLTIDKNKLIYIVKYKKNIIFDKKSNKDFILNVLFEKFIKPNIGFKNPIFIYYFPKSQSLFSKINKYELSDRFELYLNGIELANGYNEILNYKLYKKIMIKENNKRILNKYEYIKIDKNFIQDIKKNIPKCSGASLGIERLIMIYLNYKDINKVISFNIKNS